MGKAKLAKENKPKFDRNVEISAPILDPEIIKAIHSPPKGGQRVDIRHGGFKALLSDLNSQDSTDELTPLNDNHIPSYIGISCAVSGYSSYNSYHNRRPNSETEGETAATNKDGMKSLSASRTPVNRSRATSPSTTKITHQVNHIVIDRSHITSPDDERKELTEKLVASATERRRSPSPMVPPTEDDRHHGAYVGARYCPLPPPSKVINKRIPLLGIDDDQNMDELADEDKHKVEQKIASLYGDNFVEDWRESQTHKMRKELSDDHPSKQNQQQENSKTLKDLVTLRPTPKSPPPPPVEAAPAVETPDVKVLAGVEKEFLTRLLSDENPPMPKLPPYEQQQQQQERPQPMSPSHKSPPPLSPVQQQATPVRSPSPPVQSPVQPEPQLEPEPEPEPEAEPEHENESDFVTVTREDVAEFNRPESPKMTASPSPPPIERQHQRQPSIIDLDMHQQPQLHQDSPIRSPDSGKSQSISGEDDQLINVASSQVGTQEQNIEYEIRAQSPLDNLSSPVRQVAAAAAAAATEERLVSFSPDVSESKPHEVENNEQPQSLLQFNSNNNLIEENLMASDEKLPRLDEEVKVEELHAHGGSESIAQNESSQEAEREQQPEKSESPTITSVVQDGHYYLGLLNEEVSFINEQVRQMESTLELEESQMDEETIGRIRSAIGKANLLVNKKCNQFRELCESNIRGKDSSDQQQFATLNDDLAGFWDMLGLQVSDVKRSFEALRAAQVSGWQFPDMFAASSATGGGSAGDLLSGDDGEASAQSRSSSRSEKTTKATKLSIQKDQERKQRLQEHINQMKQQQNQQASGKSNENLLLEEGDEKLEE